MSSNLNGADAAEAEALPALSVQLPVLVIVVPTVESFWVPPPPTVLVAMPEPPSSSAQVKVMVTLWFVQVPAV